MLSKPNVQSESMITVTSETFSISGAYPENPIIHKMNSFHDKLADQLITEKEFSFVQDVDDEDLHEDEVFNEVELSKESTPSNVSNQPESTPEQNRAMNNFARVWAQSIRRSQYREQIFHGLSELTMIESRRDKIISNFEVFYSFGFFVTLTLFKHALTKLRRDVKQNIRKATRELRLNLLKKFEPELHKLFIIGKG